jgi:hypothetical protein
MIFADDKSEINPPGAILSWIAFRICLVFMNSSLEIVQYDH